MNLYRRRGASLAASGRQRSLGRPLGKEGVQDLRREEEEKTRSTRQSVGRSPSLRVLLARRHRWSGEPAPSSSETVIVKSLPYYPGAREALARPAREPLPSPQVHSFRLERAREEEAVLRQRAQQADMPRFSSLLLEPVAAVPSPFLQAVPAVPDLPTLATFTTPAPRPATSTSAARTRASFSRPSPTPFRARQRLSPVSAVPHREPSPVPSREVSTGPHRPVSAVPSREVSRPAVPRQRPTSPAPLPQPLPQTQARQRPNAPAPLPQTLPQTQARHRPQPPATPPRETPRSRQPAMQERQPPVFAAVGAAEVEVTTRRPVTEVTALLPTAPDPQRRQRHPELG